MIVAVNAWVASLAEAPPAVGAAGAGPGSIPPAVGALPPVAASASTVTVASEAVGVSAPAEGVAPLPVRVLTERGVLLAIVTLEGAQPGTWISTCSEAPVASVTVIISATQLA